MTTRRNKLVKPSSLTGGGPPSGKIRNMTLKELAEHRVLVPPELSDTGMSLIVLVGLDGRLQPGLVRSDEVPIGKPIQDLTRLQRARAIVSSLDVAASKVSTITEVKEQIISAAISESIDPTKIELKLGAQSELIKCKTLSSILTENQELFKTCPQNKTATYQTAASEWFDKSIISLNHYALSTQCRNQNEDLNTILLKNNVPKWFFNKFTVGKVQELATNSIDDIFFPKKLSRMITFSEKEVSEKKFIDSSGNFKEQLSLLLNIVKLHSTKEKDAILYPIPNDFSRRFSTFTDLPQIDRTVHQSSILSLTLIHMVFCALPLKAMTVDNLSLHQSSLIYDGGVKRNEKHTLEEHFDELSKGSKTVEHFKYIPEMSTSAKVQYKDFITTDGVGKIVAFRFIKPLCQVFNITDLELKSIAPGILFECNSGFVSNPKAETIFKSYSLDIVKSSKRADYTAAFGMLKPTQPKELNFGMANSPLLSESEKFLKNLATAKFHDVFQTNVKKYLQSFNNPAFQTQAIKIMHATIQARAVTLHEPPDEPQTSDTEGSDLYANYS